MKKFLPVNLIALVVFLFATIQANATVQFVTTNADSGAASLRQAISGAADGDEKTFNLASDDETITVLSELEITKSLSINGMSLEGSASALTIQASGNYLVFYMNGSGETTTLELMKLKGRNTNSGSGEAIAGNIGELKINHIVITDFKAWQGGGIYIASGGSAFLTNSLVSNNDVH